MYIILTFGRLLLLSVCEDNDDDDVEEDVQFSFDP